MRLPYSMAERTPRSVVLRRDWGTTARLIPPEKRPQMGEKILHWYSAVSQIPDGGLGFHGTSERFADGIRATGMNKNIRYTLRQIDFSRDP